MSAWQIARTGEPHCDSTRRSMHCQTPDGNCPGALDLKLRWKCDGKFVGARCAVRSGTIFRERARGSPPHLSWQAQERQEGPERRHVLLQLLVHGGLLDDVTPKPDYYVRLMALLQEVICICGVSWGAVRKRLG
jgi:hypothetical protein